MYDLIGDIHGHCDELEALLRQMGYREARRVWRHPERTAVFVGDFIDRGPKIRETLCLVRSMLEAGSALAVLGNHEWNALAFHTEDPDAPGKFLRPRYPKNVKQHAATLAQFEGAEAELASHLAFLRQLPFHLALDGVNVVHACWDDAELAVIETELACHGGLTDGFLIEGSRGGSPLHDAIEIVLKGREMTLPEGVTFVDKDGHRRREARVRWYLPPDGQTIASYTLPAFEGLPEAPLPPEVTASARPYNASLPPVFFGHYWLEAPEPEPLAGNVACLDYSVANGGLLCGYRWTPGRKIESDGYVRIPQMEARPQ